MKNMVFSCRVVSCFPIGISSPKGDPFFEMAKYTVHCANTFFRTLRTSGVFIYGRRRRLALRAGMDMNDSDLLLGHQETSLLANHLELNPLDPPIVNMLSTFCL